jgi:glycosyltransferase involved in cell wall biosynthesis
LSTEISIVIPVYNEEENVLPLAKEITLVMKAVPGSYELVFVDDCSTDGNMPFFIEARYNNSE